MDYLAITINGNTFGNEIFLDHIDQGVAFLVFRMTARQQAFRIEIRLASQLDDPLCNLIRVCLLFIRVLQELGRNTFCMDPGSHEIVPPVAQHANNFSRQRFVQDFDHGLSVGAVTFGNCALLDVLSRALAERFNVSKKWFISHNVTPSNVHSSSGKRRYYSSVTSQSKLKCLTPR